MKYKLGQTTVCPYGILNRKLYLTQLKTAIMSTLGAFLLYSEAEKQEP
jgi:hypothetical protein